MGKNLSSCLNLSILSYISSVLLHNSAESLHIDIHTKFRAIKRYYVVTTTTRILKEVHKFEV